MRAFSVMYNHTLFCACKPPDHTSGHMLIELSAWWLHTVIYSEMTVRRVEEYCFVGKGFTCLHQLKGTSLFCWPEIVNGNLCVDLDWTWHTPPGYSKDIGCHAQDHTLTACKSQHLAQSLNGHSVWWFQRANLLYLHGFVWKRKDKLTLLSHLWNIREVARTLTFTLLRMTIRFSKTFFNSAIHCL